MIQRKAAIFVFNDFARLSNVTTMLEYLGKNHRDQLTLIMFYKIINNLVEISHTHILVESPAFTRSTASNYMQELTRINSPFFQEPSDFGTAYPRPPIGYSRIISSNI